ncbi:MAG: hypothetical protein II260_05380 [Muribaculaceae bacterium]|nr:hypothetical protein [Muribaculaceae bacterium]
MKKLYSVFMMVLMTIAMSFTAKADITVTLKVDDASRLTAYYQFYDANYNTQQVDLDLTQYTGEQGSTFTISGDYGYLYVNATSGNVITYAMNETTGSSASTGSSTYFYIGSYAGAAQTISIKSADLAASRTASCTVNIDDASKVNMSYYDGSKVELVNGENIVKFNPETESQFQISHVNYGETLFSVKLNDVAQADSYGRYYVTVADGDKLDIAANFPVIPATISFSYGANESEVIGCLSAKVNGVDVTDFDGKQLSVMMGDKVTLVGNTDLYNFNYAITVNGASQYFYGSYEFTVTSETNTVEVNATKYTSYNAYITVDAPENIEVYPGTSNTPLQLTAGVATTIEMTSNNNYINVRPTTDCSIVSIQVNGVEYGTVNGYGTSGTTIRNINENDQIVITTKKIARDKVATIWVDDLSAAPYGYGVQRYSDRASVTLVSGEAATVNFDDSDNPYYLSFYGPTYCTIFQNGIYTAPQYEGSTSYYVTLADGDAVKVYLASEPNKYAVTFSQNVENAVTSVSTDGQVYANWANGFTALEGTKVTLAVDAENAEVTVGGEKANVDENGNYVVEITKDTEIVISEASGIENINIENAYNGNVYNMQGILVIKNANAEQINTLPAGLYIVNGKKVIRK